MWFSSLIPATGTVNFFIRFKYSVQISPSFISHLKYFSFRSNFLLHCESHHTEKSRNRKEQTGGTTQMRTITVQETQKKRKASRQMSHAAQKQQHQVQVQVIFFLMNTSTCVPQGHEIKPNCWEQHYHLFIVLFSHKVVSHYIQNNQDVVTYNYYVELRFSNSVKLGGICLL